MSASTLPTAFEPLMASTPKGKTSSDKDILKVLDECAMKLESIAVMEMIKDGIPTKKGKCLNVTV